MAKFILLTSTNPKILGKMRINIDHISNYFPEGSRTAIVLGLPGFGEAVQESVAEVDRLIAEANKPVFAVH